MVALVLSVLLLSLISSSENNFVNWNPCLRNCESPSTRLRSLNSDWEFRLSINSTLVTNRTKLILQCGDIIPQPGPTNATGSSATTSGATRTSSTGRRTPKFPCGVCSKAVTAASKAVSCDGDGCNVWTHQRCTGGEITADAYLRFTTGDNHFSFYCSKCLFSNLSFDCDDNGDDDEVFIGSEWRR